MEQEVVVPGHKEELSKLITSIDSYCSDTELLHIHWVVRVVQPPCIRGLQENYLEYSRAAESKTGKHAKYKRCCRFKVFFFLINNPAFIFSQFANKISCLFAISFRVFWPVCSQI